MSPEVASPESDKQPQKRKASSTGANGRAIKRRASKACQCCRARKVRCNVVEHGAPCTNCRLDEVPCVVTESKRKKKPGVGGSLASEHSHVNMPGMSSAEALASGSVNPTDITNPAFRRMSDSGSSMNEADEDVHAHTHVPHALYQNQSQRLDSLSRNYVSIHQQNRPFNVSNLLSAASIHGDLVSGQIPQGQTLKRTANGPLPAYIKPLPQRMNADDIHYLWKKGALSIPDTTFRNELIRNYVEYVHPYMPLVDLKDFLRIVDDNHGETGKISLLLFQAVMFAGTAFVDMSYLKAAGFSTRKAARKAFYQKSRVLYDFDYEMDRLSLVQSLLLMTYWYETPDDQKDTWHWMGVAISLAHTIGLHRNPEKSNMDLKKQRFWKRIWWSCFMRDRLVALGMRRPTRIKDEDCDVPMLTLDDFEIENLSTECIANCTLVRDVAKQKDLALLCIAKAKLCLCVSHVLSAQYSVLVRDQGMAQGQEGNTRSSVMLFPKKLDQSDEVKLCDIELEEWVRDLSAPCLYTSITPDVLARDGSSVAVQRGLLHMVYFATLSALHRPQVLPSTENAALQKCRELQDMSRTKVREASREITRISQDLHNFQLVRYLPTTGVTVLLPAIIIHLLDIKSSSNSTREEALSGFVNCMQVLEKLRDNYAAADYATQFLEAAIRKADLNITLNTEPERSDIGSPEEESLGLPTQSGKRMGQNSQLFDLGRATRLTPPPDSLHSRLFPPNAMDPRSDSFPNSGFSSATTPPNSDSSIHNEMKNMAAPVETENRVMEFGTNFDDGFDALFNFDGLGEGTMEWGGMHEEGMHGESGAFLMDWMKEDEQLQWGGAHQHAPKLHPEEEALFLLQAAQ